jgi:hypothetical protein
MAARRSNLEFESIREAAAFRAGIALRTVEALMPNATGRQMKRIANRILSLTDGRDRSTKITPAQARDLILPHIQCIQRECPLLIFDEPLSRVR